LQAETYQLEFPEIVIDSFRAGSRRDVDDPELQKTLAAILDLSDEESP
jgi:hypothetical protein